MISLKDAAITYAKTGLRVFPLAPNSKGQQVVNSWINDATNDIDQINDWWTINPNYNIGIVTGKEIFVIDVDIKENVDGLKAIEQYGKELPTTYTVKSPHGGFHYYYSVGDIPVKTRTNLYEGIDIRGIGGYIVAPPSCIDGYFYRADNNKPIAPANKNVYRFLEPKVVQKEELYGKVNKGQRNDYLFKLGCSLRNKGLSNKAIIISLKEKNINKCMPPLTEKEVERIVKSVCSYENVEQDYSMVRMSSVNEKEIEWVVEGYIPKGQITMLVGDGGVGKTTAWINIASKLSSGEQCFFENEKRSRKKLKVGYFSSEDPYDSILKRKLNLNLAEQENILTIPISDERFPQIKFNSPFLEELIIENQLDVIIFDPLQSFIPDNINMGARNAMRSILNSCLKLGERYNVSTLIIAHTNKRENAGGRNRASDSSDIWDIARSVLFIGHTGEDDIHYLSQEKSNYGVLQDTILFKIEDDIIVKTGTTKKRDIDFQSNRSINSNVSLLTEAKELLLELLNEGDKDSSDIMEIAKECEISSTTLKRAKAELKKEGKIITKRIGSNKGNDKQKTVFSLNI